MSPPRRRCRGAAGALVRGLAKLSPEHRQVVTCRYLLDLDEAETAAVLGWPRGTVKSRLHRALARLRDVLDAEPSASRTREVQRARLSTWYDDLARDWRRCGRAVDVPAPDPGLATAVLDGSARRCPGPARAWRPRLARERRRLVALAVGAVLLALLATPPVRAAVADWFGFGGVRVERGAHRHRRPPDAAHGGAGRLVSEAAASGRASRVSVPEELGDPDGVEVSPDRRMVSMSWATDEDGVVRLDQFDARFDFSVLKTRAGRLLRRGRRDRRAVVRGAARGRAARARRQPAAPSRPGSPGTR